MTDSIIYEAQPIPPHDPDSGRRKWSAIFGAVAVIALLLVGVAFGATLFRGEDEPDPLAEPDPTQTTLTSRTPTTVVSPLFSRDQRSSRGFFGGAESSIQPARPGGDAGTPTAPLPPQEFTWEKVTLDLPEGDEAYLQGVYAVDDGFVALGMSYSETGQNMVVWKSADGLTWDRTALNGDFSNANVWNVVFNEFGAVAIGEEFVDYGESEISYRPYSPVRLVWTSTDGVKWARTELDLEVWINAGVAGPSGFLVVGQRSTSPDFEPMIIEKDGYQLEMSEYTYTYRLLNTSGAVVAEGSMDDLYQTTYSDDGQAIVHPETGEILTVIPFETWERAWAEAYSESSGGLFGGYTYTPPVLTIEFDGYLITVDEETDTYDIEVIATGEVISSDSASYLWDGPAPVITGADGTELLRFSWEEFDAAQQAYWEDNEARWDYEFKSDVVVAVSTDGATWTESVIATDAQQVSFDSVIARENGYVAYGSHYDEYRGGSAVWTSPDGLNWEQAADMPGGMYIWNVKQAADGTLLAIGEGPQGQALWSSTDGIAWGEAFGTRIPEDRNQFEWFNQVGTGQLGTVVVGSREQNYYDEEYYSSNPLTLTQDEYTLTFDDYDWPPRIVVIDNTTEDVVIDTTLDEEGGLPPGFSYEDGVTYVENNGIVLMTITDYEWARVQEDHWQVLEETYVYEPAQSTMYFSTDLDEWTEVPFEFEGWIGHVAVGTDSVVLAGEEYYEEQWVYEDGAYGEEFAYTPPDPVVFVGRP